MTTFSSRLFLFNLCSMGLFCHRHQHPGLRGPRQRHGVILRAPQDQQHLRRFGVRLRTGNPPTRPSAARPCSGASNGSPAPTTVGIRSPPAETARLAFSSPSSPAPPTVSAGQLRWTSWLCSGVPGLSLCCFGRLSRRLDVICYGIRATLQHTTLCRGGSSATSKTMFTLSLFGLPPGSARIWQLAPCSLHPAARIRRLSHLAARIPQLASGDSQPRIWQLGQLAPARRILRDCISLDLPRYCRRYYVPLPLDSLLDELSSKETYAPARLSI